VVFPRGENGLRAYSVVERADGVRFRVDGGVAGARLPHDLAHLIVEQETGNDAGFWGAVSAGAVFRSMTHLDGRQPPHARDRSAAALRERRDGLRRAELVVWLTERVARGGVTSPQRVRAAAREALSTMPGSSVDAERVIAFETPAEADLVDALRDDASWLPGLSVVATDRTGRVVAHALLTRCSIGATPALCLAPCAVLPELQRRGAGSAALRAALDAARKQGETYVTVLGRPGYYPRFGFRRASTFGITADLDVPDEALMAMTLDEARPLPAGTIRYAAPFGI
jgi:putative acetyltransferase